MEDERVFSALDAAFAGAVAKSIPTRGPVTVLYSGGIDSSLVADGARAIADVALVSVGLPGAADFESARDGARDLGLPLLERTVDRSELATLVVALELRTEPEPRRSVLVSLAAAFVAAPAGPLLLGQGADELFGGYAHFRGLSDEDADRRRRSDWERLRDVDWPATRSLARRFGREVGAPFLDEGFVEVALSVPIVPFGPGQLSKPRLRRWATHRGLPRSIVERPKRAMQYGTGIAAAMRKLDRPTPVPP